MTAHAEIIPSVVDRIKQSLVGLKMPRAIEILDATVRRIERGEMNALEAIDALLAEELALRENRRIKMALVMARLSAIKTLAGFDFSFQPSLDKNRVMALAELQFIDRAEVLHLIGPPGTGKSHLSLALGVEAVKAGRSVYFGSLADIVGALAKAEREGLLREKIRFFRRFALLIVDEIGYLPVIAGGGNLFFQLVNARYEKGAMAAWNKIPKNVISCVEARRGALEVLIDRGIGPDNSNIKGDLIACKATQRSAQNTAQATQSPFSVAGFTLGSIINPNNSVYKQYKCAPSDTFNGLVLCYRKNQEHGSSGEFESIYSILHTQSNSTVYVSRSIKPAFFKKDDVLLEIERLNKLFGSKAKLLSFSGHVGLQEAVIASWGKVNLEALDKKDTTNLSSRKNRQSEILVDFIGNLQTSSAQGLPVYRLNGGAGFVWIASFDAEGKGALRLLAIDMTKFPQDEASSANSKSLPAGTDQPRDAFALLNVPPPPTAFINTVAPLRPPEAPPTMVGQTPQEDALPKPVDAKPPIVEGETSKTHHDANASDGIAEGYSNRTDESQTNEKEDQKILEQEQEEELAAEADRLGPDYARDAGVTFEIFSDPNTLEDSPDKIAKSIQSNGLGAVAEISGKCEEPGWYDFTALVVDDQGHATLDIPNLHNDGLWVSHRVNSDPISTFFAAKAHFDNKFVVAYLVNLKQFFKNRSTDPKDLFGMMRNAKLGLGLSIQKPPLFSTTWRILIEIPTSRGNLIVKIPTYDPVLRNGLSSCLADHE